MQGGPCSQTLPMLELTPLTVHCSSILSRGPKQCPNQWDLSVIKQLVRSKSRTRTQILIPGSLSSLWPQAVSESAFQKFSGLSILPLSQVFWDRSFFFFFKEVNISNFGIRVYFENSMTVISSLPEISTYSQTHNIWCGYSGGADPLKAVLGQCASQVKKPCLKVYL